MVGCKTFFYISICVKHTYILENTYIYKGVCVIYGMNLREQQRIEKIEQVLNNIKRLKANFDEKQFILDIMVSQQVTDRKAKEYFKIALHQYKLLQKADE